MKDDSKLARQWKTINRAEVDLMKELRAFIEEPTLTIHVGTDAQSFGRNTADYVTCVIIHGIKEDGRALARVFYIKDKKVPTNSLWEKLYNETMASIMVAKEISTEEEAFQDRIVVHVDANPDKRFESSNYVKSLAGMVMGFGFRHLLKPDSWAASHASDHIVKNKHHKMSLVS